MRNSIRYIFILLISAPILSGCLSLKEKAAIKAAQEEAEQLRQQAELSKTFKPPVVIYRIDDHRFFTLEEFNEKRRGMTFYNNTQTGAHFKVYHGSACNFRGRLIWAAKQDDYIAFPAAASNWEGCASRRDGCQSSVLLYSKGQFIPAVLPLGSMTLNPVKETGYFTIIVADTHFYVGKSHSTTPHQGSFNDLYWEKYPYPTLDEVKNKTWNSYFKETPPSDIKTPSGQTQFDCTDPSISPMSKLGDYGKEYRLEK